MMPVPSLVVGVETRWSLGDDRDYLLRRALRDYLNSLFPLYPEPEEGKYDPRKSLLQSPFLSHVLNEVRPLLPKRAFRSSTPTPGSWQSQPVR